MKRYFQADVEDATRIAVVEADDDNETAGYVWDDEIEESELPDEFATWKCYERYSTSDATVHVMSQDGD
jgi:hypothetical protein